MKSRILATTAATLMAVQALAHVPSPSPPDPHSGSPVGVVAFENSGRPVAQKDFLYGLAQLHNFEYGDAAAAFRRAQQADPGFALAYWGEAMTYNHPVWMQQDAASARAVLARFGPDRAARLARVPTERERAYLDAVETLYGEGDKFERDRRYAAAMRRLHERWPGDVDATAFYALAMLGTAHDGRDVPTYMRAYALLDEPFRSHPRHPGLAHYLIHSVDDAAHAPLGLAAARAYGRIAPEAPHALHMTSHIYLALGLWDDVASANERAYAVAVRRAQAAGRAPRGCGHGLTWLSYAYLQQGRPSAAKRLLAQCLEEVRDAPKYRDDEDQFDPDASSVASFYSMRLRFLLDGPPDAEVARWRPDADGVPIAAFIRDYGDAVLALRDGDVDAANAAVPRARASADRLNAAMARHAIDAGAPVRRMVAIELAQLDAWLAWRRGDQAGGLAALETVAREEDALPAAFGPPQIDAPTHEVLGALLVTTGRAAEARREFERALVENPGRVGPRRGALLCARRLGDAAEAEALAADLKTTLAHAEDGAAP
jgi:tetratricopeptide (TPR) repeat protein